jgi:hypothetical protein
MPATLVHFQKISELGVDKITKAKKQLLVYILVLRNQLFFVIANHNSSKPISLRNFE